MLIQQKVLHNLCGDLGYLVVGADLEDASFTIDFHNKKLLVSPRLSVVELRGVIDIAAMIIKYQNQELYHRYYHDMQDIGSCSLFFVISCLRVVRVGAMLMSGIKYNIEYYIKSDIERNLQIFSASDDIDQLFINELIYQIIDFDIRGHEKKFLQDVDQNYILDNMITDLKEMYLYEELYYAMAVRVIAKWRDVRQVFSLDELQQTSDGQVGNNGGQRQKSKKISGDQDKEKVSDNGKKKDIEGVIGRGLNNGGDRKKGGIGSGYVKELKGDKGSVIDDQGMKTVDDIVENNQKILNSLLSTVKASGGSDNSHYVYGYKYKVYSNVNDEVIHARHLVTNKEIYSLNIRFNELTQDNLVNKFRAYKFYSKLVKTASTCNMDNINGRKYLDGKRLALKIANPLYNEIYKGNELQNILSDSFITILVDNSGSMCGRSIEMIAVTTDLIVKICDKLSIKTEVLGFTTKNWHGGNSKKLWVKNERPRDPGRLNDIRYIIYKSKNESWRFSRRNLAVMLKESIMKENIDGEAVLWASKRMHNYHEGNKILIVISDGVPVDDATNQANSKDYLLLHLQEVAEMIEKRSLVKLFAISISKESKYVYRNSINLTSFADINDKIFDYLPKMIFHK